MRRYPKAKERRVSAHEPEVQKSRFAVLRAAARSGIILTLLFLSLFCYLFGSLYQLVGHTHNLNVAFVDYDGGLIGDAVRQAYQRLRGDSFPTLIEHPSGQYPQPAALRSAVCNIDYWGALYISAGASDRLATAISDAQAAASYNRSDVLTWVWNEARYPTVIDTLAQQITALAEAARVAYVQLNGTGAIQSLDATSLAAVEAYSNPWELASINIQPTAQGSRLVYNTLVIVLLLIQEFFFLATINGLYVQFGLFGRLKPRRMIIYRFMISGLYTLAGSICTTGAIWAFRAEWQVNGSQWALTWITLWLFAHLNFLTLDVVAVWLPPPYVPMGLITWVVLNISSILIPFELSPAFYKWAYALPAHACYSVLIDIWSGGCNPRLGYALPVLFAYELSSGTLSAIGVYRRAHYAVIAAEREEKSWQEKIASAIADSGGASAPIQGAGTAEGVEVAKEEDVESSAYPQRKSSAESASDREELAGRIWRATSQMTLGQSSSQRKDSLGPSFTLG
ncbi:SNG1 family protein [Aspergillus lucknowensis]|uniref:DUF3533 domain-containing protein n=1 Tax=Aspergillus lucknowensis TaxID=176173 RepID=A0ABR4LSX2_9EURO